MAMCTNGATFSQPEMYTEPVVARLEVIVDEWLFRNETQLSVVAATAVAAGAATGAL